MLDPLVLGKRKEKEKERRLSGELDRVPRTRLAIVITIIIIIIVITRIAADATRTTLKSRLSLVSEGNLFPRDALRRRVPRNTWSSTTASSSPTPPSSSVPPFLD